MSPIELPSCKLLSIMKLRIILSTLAALSSMIVAEPTCDHVVSNGGNSHAYTVVADNITSPVVTCDAFENALRAMHDCEVIFTGCRSMDDKHSLVAAFGVSNTCDRKRIENAWFLATLNAWGRIQCIGDGILSSLTHG